MAVTRRRVLTAPGSFACPISARPLRECSGSTARTGTVTAAYRPITGPGLVKGGELGSSERASVHEGGRDRAPVLRVLTPDDADRQALLDEWVLRQRAAGLSEKTIRERLGI